MPSELDIKLHIESLSIGRLFHEAYAKFGGDNPLTIDLLEAYRNIRRHIGIDRRTGKRYGAEQASEIIKEATS